MRTCSAAGSRLTGRVPRVGGPSAPSGAGIGRSTRRAPTPCSPARRSTGGPATAGRVGAGRSVGRSGAAAAGAGPVRRRPRSATSGRAYPLRRWCSAGKSSTVGDGELVALAGVAAVERVSTRRAGPDQRRGRLGAQRGARRVEPGAGRRGWASSAPARAARGGEQPDRGQHAGAGRDDARRASRARRRPRRRAAARRRRTRPAPDPARVDARAPRVTTRTACSIAASTTATTPAASTPALAERGAGRGRRRAGPRPGKVGLGVEPAEHEVGIGDGRLGAAPPVAGRAGHGAGAAGPDGQRAARVEAGDRAAAGADGVHVERGQSDRVAGDDALGGRRRARRPGSRHTSVLVPPMSNVTASGKPHAAATAAAARTPPAGPESSSAAGRSAAVPAGHQPAGRGHDEHLVGERRPARAR